MLLRPSLLLLAGLLLPATAPAADGPAPVDVPRLDGEIAIDGVIDEGAWQQAASIDIGYEFAPSDNTPAPAKSTMRIGYSRDALYLAFDAQDPDPSRIRAHLTDRDGAFNDDFIGVMLDTFDDHRRNYEFFVNPLGVQMDLIQDDVNRNESSSWNAIWDSEGQINERGFTVEISIPVL